MERIEMEDGGRWTSNSAKHSNKAKNVWKVEENRVVIRLLNYKPDEHQIQKESKRIKEKVFTKHLYTLLFFP
tara:strand:- start:10 stop:225 length:216 start_codon:yes stop_codon:yes gene_type:complete